MSSFILIISDLPLQVTINDLRNLYNHFGELKDIRMNQGSSFAFVEYFYPENATNALETTKNQLMYGQRIR